MKVIVDERIRDEEYEYLKEELKLKVFKLPLSDDVYDEISGHSDIFYTVIDNKVICSPNAKIIEPNFLIGRKKVTNKYPEDVKYNICQIGKNIIGSKYADELIKDKINILVKQGYVKCSICVTSKNSCITTDIGIHKELIKKKIDSIYIKEENIKLVDKNGKISKMKGFIGGAAVVIENKFILFGDFKKLSLENQEKILNHLDKYNLKLKYFDGIEIIDYGGLIMYN